MLFARVDGTIVPATCHPSMAGRRTVICQPLDADGRAEGAPVLAVDPLGAGLHQRVILSTDGAATRALVNDPHTPLRNLIIGLADGGNSESEGEGGEVNPPITPSPASAIHAHSPFTRSLPPIRLTSLLPAPFSLLPPSPCASAPSSVA